MQFSPVGGAGISAFAAGISSSGFGGSHFLQLSPLPPPPMKFAGVPYNRRTTTLRPAVLASYPPLPIYPVLESFDIGTTDAPVSDSPTFLPPDWINRFNHNDTHVNITMGNETLSLLWKDELVN